MTHTPILLRPAVPADAPALARIYAPHVLDGVASYETVPPDAAAMESRLAAVLAAGLPWLVAVEAAGEQAGAIRGYAYATPFRTRSAYRWTVENSVYVAVGQQGRGIGRMLLAQLVEICTGSGYRRMIAVIGDAGNAASIALHRGLGFVEAGVIPGAGCKHGRWLDLLIMQRPLGAGSDSVPSDAPQHG